MTLDALASDTLSTISRIEWSAMAPDEAKRLRALGIDDGAEITVIYRGVFGTRDPIAVRLGRMTIALRRSHALAIQVEPVPMVPA